MGLFPRTSRVKIHPLLRFSLIVYDLLIAKIYPAILTGVLIKPKILFVDDNLSFIKSVLTFLKLNESFEFAGFASSGEEAIQKIGLENPDLILMDIQMPGIDGIEATRIIKKMNPGIKIVILSLHEEDQYIQLAKSAGADGFISKSRFVDEFQLVINSLSITGVNQ